MSRIRTPFLVHLAGLALATAGIFAIWCVWLLVLPRILPLIGLEDMPLVVLAVVAAAILRLVDRIAAYLLPLHDD